MRRRQLVVTLSAAIAACVMACSPLTYAQQQPQSSSGNYQVDRVFMGAGGELNACSSGGTGYCAKQSAGEIAAGNLAGTLFRANAGFNVEREPYIAFSVASSTTDLGYLSQFGTAYTSGTFAVKTYLSQGYVVQVVSDPPTNVTGGHQITPMTTAGGPSPGTEQFGMNLASNTLPATFGADPVQVPDNTFSFGTVAAGYDTTNTYKYNKGDTVASSTKSSGETDYTVSFIYDIGQMTPDGTYVFNGVFVATSTF
ncbi:MAG TPA: hypothetical protein VLE73_05420 [Candidatus Saccharimonadales bacterium]|nr:hypothetical protein [Candidatus Saccharimonadales bacterium]